MVCPMREGFKDDAEGNASDQFDRSRENEASDDSEEIVGSQPSENLLDVRRSVGPSGAWPGRIRDVLRHGAESDPLLGREEVESVIFLWLQALDHQVMGGCRSDERLKPLLKQNTTSSTAEDQFVTQLVQYFEASEVAVLARCLCVPLVSVRVGKITKQGNLLCPTALRGFLSLTLLPSSHMRISFTGDDECIERLAVVSNDLESSSVIIEGLSADTSGRSFQLKFSDSRTLFFWCSEKSKSDGMELIVKMKDLLGNKPSLSGLTGISKSRLDSFAARLRDNMFASASTPTVTAITSSSGSQMASSSSSELDLGCQSKSPHSRVPTAHASKSHLVYQTSLSPKSNAFKDGNSSTRNCVRERVRRRGDSSIAVHLSTAPVSSHDQSMIPNGGNAESYGLLRPMLSPLSPPLFSLCSTFTIPSKFSSQSSFFSPSYCWCPPGQTSLQYSSTSHLSNSSEFLPLPPLSTLLSSASPPESLATSKFSFEVTELPPLKLPASLLPDPMLHLPMPISSICSLPSSQQIATFTPFMSDPIVHIPMIDICSSGQGYLVSAGPSISGSIPPLPSLANHQLIPPMESLVEKNARETLRVLMASTPAFSPPKLFNVFPVVLSSMELYGNGTSVPGNGGLFKGAVDTESINCGISILKLPSSGGDICRDVLDDGIEEGNCPNANDCHCPNSNNCRMTNTESDEM